MMLPEADIREHIKHHPVKSLSQPVQTFYNGPCAAVDVDNMSNIDDIDSLVHLAMKSAPEE